MAAARTLAAQGHQPVVYEASPKVGGRVHTERLGGYVFDTGATTIAPRGRVLERAMFDELDREGLTRIERPIFIHSGLRVSMGDPAKNRVDRFAYVTGNETLPIRLAEGLDVRLSQRIETVERRGDGFAIQSEGYDAVVLAAPTPDVLPLLEGLGESRPFSNANYRPCLSVLLGYAFEPPNLNYHALVEPENNHPLAWLSHESLKCPGRAPDGHCAVVAQLGPQFSKMYFEAPDADIIDATADLLVRLYSKAWDAPAVATVQRWAHSQPEMTALFDNVNRPGARLLVAGDGVMGGRVEYAYDAGVRAAQRLMGIENHAST